jgi:hypothetical protein
MSWLSFSIRYTRPSAIEWASPLGHSRPLSQMLKEYPLKFIGASILPSKSFMPPTPVVTTGTIDAIASMMETGVPSLFDGNFSKNMGKFNKSLD